MHALYSWRLLRVTFPWKTGVVIGAVSVFSATVAINIVESSLAGNLLVLLGIYAGVFVFVSYLVKPLLMEDVELLQQLNPHLYRMGKVFVRCPRPIPLAGGSVCELSDRQKFAFAWMPPSHTVVDIGSSTGPLCRILTRKAAIAVAVDTNATALNVLRARGDGTHPVESSAQALPFRTGSIDTALLLDVLEHTSNDRQVINEVLRILRPGGTLLLSVPNKGLFQFLDPQNLSARLRGALSKSTFHRHYSERDLKGLLSPGFQVQKRHYGGLFLYPVSFATDNFLRKHFGLNWNRLFAKIGDLDNDISWGSLSYNLILCAVKM
jgi:SAM-dependent methyltransferase